MTHVVLADLPAIVFMKVGQHAGEDFHAILERKQEEFERTGRVFWGYGGGTMHPIQKVQLFAQMKVEQGVGITLVMQSIDSRHGPTEARATKYSKDGVNWEDIPDGISVRGSRYALVLDEIHPGDLTINLSQYRVGVGPSVGRVATEYVRGRVDKACLELVAGGVPGAEPQLVTVGPWARLKEPYAVLLK